MLQNSRVTDLHWAASVQPPHRRIFAAEQQQRHMRYHGGGVKVKGSRLTLWQDAHAGEREPRHPSPDTCVSAPPMQTYLQTAAAPDSSCLKFRLDYPEGTVLISLARSVTQAAS